MTATGIDLEKLRDIADDLCYYDDKDKAYLIWSAIKEIEQLRLQLENKSNDYWSK